MKLRQQNIQQTIIVSIALLLTALFILSWLVSIYVDGVNGLLTVRGIRWYVGNGWLNFKSAPVVEIASALSAFSVLRESRIHQAFSAQRTIKQSYALRVTLIAAVLILALIGLLLFLPKALLLSSFGTIENSPFSHGAFGLLILFFIAIGSLYGFISGRFLRLHDFIHSLTSIFRTASSYFLLLFLSSQFITCLDYTDLILLFTQREHLVLTILTIALYYLPLLAFLPRYSRLVN